MGDVAYEQNEKTDNACKCMHTMFLLSGMWKKGRTKGRCDTIEYGAE